MKRSRRRRAELRDSRRYSGRPPHRRRAPGVRATHGHRGRQLGRDRFQRGAKAAVDQGGPRPVGRRGAARRRLRCGRRSPITGHFQPSAVRTGSGLRAIRLTWNCASMNRNIGCVSRSGRTGGLAWRSHPPDHVSRLARCSCGRRIADARGRRRRPTTPEHCSGIVCRAGARRLGAPPRTVARDRESVPP